MAYTAQIRWFLSTHEKPTWRKVCGKNVPQPEYRAAPLRAAILFCLRTDPSLRWLARSPHDRNAPTLRVTLSLAIPLTRGSKLLSSPFALSGRAASCEVTLGHVVLVTPQRQAGPLGIPDSPDTPNDTSDAL